MLTPYRACDPDPRLLGLRGEFPAEVFDDLTYKSCELMHRYVLEHSLDLLEPLGLVEALREGGTAEEIHTARGFVDSFAPALRFLLSNLSDAGLLTVEETSAGRRYRLVEALPASNRTALRELGKALDPVNLVTLDLVDAAARAYPDLAAGRTTGQEALFGAGTALLWMKYFSNDNPAYAVNNHAAAVAAANRLPERGKIRVLEVGAGAGSATQAFLTRLAANGMLDRIELYAFTEPSQFFRRRAQRELPTRFAVPFYFESFDIDGDWTTAGPAPGAYDLVFGVNVFHVAQDLGATLRGAAGALAPGGCLVAGECIRPFDGQPVPAEFVFGVLESFNGVVLDPLFRPNPGFLTHVFWNRALQAAGFEHTEVVPDHGVIRDVFPRFFTGAVCGRTHRQE